jgi:hypothetical protein
MASVRYVASGVGLGKFQAAWFLFHRVYTYVEATLYTLHFGYGSVGFHLYQICGFDQWELTNSRWSIVNTRGQVHGSQHSSEECTVESVPSPTDGCSESAMALQKAVYLNGVTNLLRRSVAVTHGTHRVLSNYFAIDEYIFGLTQEQKQVMTYLYIFNCCPVLSAGHCLGNRCDWWFGHCPSPEATNPTTFRGVELLEIRRF